MDVLNQFAQYAREIEKDRSFPEFTRETKVRDLGIDSLAMMEIIGKFEDTMKVRIPDEKLAMLETVGDIERVLLDLRPAGQA